MLALPDRQRKKGQSCYIRQYCIPLALFPSFPAFLDFGQADDGLDNLQIGTQNLYISQYIQLKICLFLKAKNHGSLIMAPFN